MISELNVYDERGREELGTRPRIWLSRWLIQRAIATNELTPFYAQQFRHQAGPMLLAHGLAMPDINLAIPQFEAEGMISAVPAMNQTNHSRKNFVAVDSEAWRPYKAFFAAHEEAFVLLPLTAPATAQL